MKILYVDPLVNNTPYRYYSYLFEALEAIPSTNISLTNHLVTDLDQIEADVVVFGLGSLAPLLSSQNPRLKNTQKKKIIVFLFKPQNDLERKLEFCKSNQVDLILTPLPHYQDYARATGIKCQLFPYGVSLQVFHPRKEITKRYDIGFSGTLHESHYYPTGAFGDTPNLRTKISQLLKADKTHTSFWHASDRLKAAYIDNQEEYAQTINAAKMWIATQAAWWDVTPRFYEILGSGTLLFCQEPPPEYRHIFINEKNCVYFNPDLTDFSEKLSFYASHSPEREKIAKAGHMSMVSSHTWGKRAQQFLQLAAAL